ncbi:MAG: extracellular solute-binding protein [Chloroflexi bacterium]|nr:extracellular solute-binding protein [Chloroflexota bacterium]
MPDEIQSPAVNRREFLRWLGIVGGLAATGGLIEACAPVAAPPAPTRAPATTVPAVKASSKVAIYSALGKPIHDQLIAAFQAANPGIDAKILRAAGAGDLQSRIRTEQAAPKADIFIGGESAFHEGIAREGLLEKYVSPNADKIADTFKDPQGFWTGWNLAVFSLALNAERLAKEMPGVKMPTTWDDLLDPAWKGKLVSPDPMRNVGGYVFLATQVFRFARDEAKAMEFMKRLHVNITQYVRNASDGIKLVVQGKAIACPAWRYEILAEKAKGTSIELVMPENSSYEIGAISIVKDAPNLGGARSFLDWLLTREAGELIVKILNRVSVLKEVAPPPGALTLEQLKLVNYDRQWAAENKDRLLKAWQKAVR